MRYFFVFILMLMACLFLHPLPAAAQQSENISSVRILGYFMVGRDDIPEANVTTAQFSQHLETLKNGDYTVISLEEMTTVYQNNAPLPEKSVAITFDGGDKSILTHAAPLLEAYKFPYTVFIATERADANDVRYLNWKDIKRLRKSGLMSIGLHGQKYKSISYDTPKTIEKNINNATARLRDKDIENKGFFAYPFGEYSATYDNIIQRYNFKAVMGQHSGVAYNSAPQVSLPRFMMTEAYADLDRFNMVLNSHPITTTDITPTTSIINDPNPAIGFTVTDDLTNDLDKLSCFASGQSQPHTSILGNRVEIRLGTPAKTDRFRVNCTLPTSQENDLNTTSWRWLGFLFHVHDTQKNKHLITEN